MRTSRTSPTKLATAPTLLSFEMARTSAPRSKSSRWTATFIRCLSSTRDRGKECHLVAGLDRRRRLRHVLIHRRAHRAVGCERARPGAAACAQVVAQAADRIDIRRQLELLAGTAELLPEGREEEDRNLHQ